MERRGPTFPEHEVVELLGIGTEEVEASRAAGSVLALPTFDSNQYPRWQFYNSALRPVTLEIMTAFADAEVSPYIAASWAISPQPEFGDCNPASWNNDGENRTPVLLGAQRAAHLESTWQVASRAFAEG